jgi:transposase
MWTAKNRGRYDRSKLRYPSDLTDDEWAHVEPLIPPAKRGGNKRHVEVREVMNGIMYILSTGCQWRAIPKDLPPRSTLFDYLDLWSYDGTLDRIHHALYVACRERDEREASPTAAIVDSQSVKSAIGICEVKARGEWVAPPHPCLLSPAARFPGTETSYPVSSNTSRLAAVSACSPGLSLPFGRTQDLSLRNRTIAMRGLEPSRKTIPPAARIGAASAESVISMLCRTNTREASGELART